MADASARLFAAAVCLAAPAALATDAPVVALEWSAPGGCPTRDDVQAHIARLLAGTTQSVSDVEVRARVTQSGSEWQVRLETRQGGRRGGREITAESCSAAADAAALVVAMSIDPETALQNQSAPPASAPAPAPPRPPPPAPAPAPPPRRPPPPAPPARRRARRAASAPDRHPPGKVLALGTALAGDVGRLPGPALGFALVVSATPDPWRVELGASLWWPEDATVPDHPDASAHFRLIAGRARGCYRIVARPLGVTGCGGADLSWIVAQGSGVRVPERGDEWWVSPALGGELAWPATGPVSALLALDAAVALGRRPFAIDGVTVHEPSAISGSALLGVEAHF